MTKVTLIGVLLLLLNSSTAFAQNTSSKSSPEMQWEYLVVTVGEGYTRYESVQNLEQAKSKIEAGKKFGFSYQDQTNYSQLSEYYTMQAALDSLGKLGWELAGVIPVESNPPRLIFKRSYDAERSRREAEQLKAKQSESKTPIQASKKRVEFIDLDLAETVAVKQDVENKAAAKLEQALRNIKDIPIIEIKVKSYFQQNGEPVTQAQIIVDGSQALLKDSNKYRLSEANNYLRQVAMEIFNKLGLRRSDAGYEPFTPYNNLNVGTSSPRIQILVSVNLSSEGVSKTVAAGTLFGSWAELAKKE